MSSIKVTESQYNKLRKNPGTAAQIIRFAISRFESGTLVIHFTEKSKEVLKVLPIRNKPAYHDEKIRAILDAHFNNPVSYQDKIDALDREIAAMMNMLPKVIIEKVE